MARGLGNNEDQALLRKAQVPVAAVPGDREDFDAKFQMGRYAEDQLVNILARDGAWVAIHYGASRTRLDNSAKGKQIHNDWYASTETLGKRPDLLIYRKADYIKLQKQYLTDAGNPLIDDLENTSDERIPLPLLQAAIGATEVEISAFMSERMPQFGKPSPKKFKGTDYDGIGFTGKTGYPNLFLKAEDITRLKEWRNYTMVPILFAQFFLDNSYLFPMKKIEKAIRDKAIKPEVFAYSSKEKRKVYRAWYTLGAKLADTVEAPTIVPVIHIDRAGRANSVITLEGGAANLSNEAKEVLASLDNEKPRA